MDTFLFLIKNFFTHKDFLPSSSEIAGTLFTPLHLTVAVIWAVLVALCCFLCAKRSEKTLKIIFAGIWVTVVVLEISKILWETYSGNTVRFEWGGILPLYPCSIFLYAFPFAIWGKDKVRFCACGYVCSLGILGGLINFVYPVNVLSNYSCISFAGFHTLFYHSILVFVAVTMLITGYHSYKTLSKPYELLLPAVPFLILSVVANAVNFSPIGSDYMFFKLNSFFFAPIGAATPDILSVIIVYIAYLVVHALPYLPFYFRNRKKA